MKREEPIIFIVDDDEHSRVSVGAMVATMGLKARTFASAEEFLNAYDGEAGCLVSDLRMPGRSAVELLQLLHQRDQMLPTIVISAYAEISVTVEAMRHGAITLLEKPYRDNEMWNAIREALLQDGEHRVSVEERRTIRGRLEQLTLQERSVMDLVLNGFLNKEIAKRLGVSLRTVESRRQHILEKMQVNSVARLVQDVMVANDGQRPSSTADHE